ncbi:MAG: hypothetical protein QOJ58_5582, partial [Alphaproteobacteria bacterium]|nr:hypothetical protein [Alphaproteobacteria bacterium]
MNQVTDLTEITTRSKRRGTRTTWMHSVGCSI